MPVLGSITHASAALAQQPLAHGTPLGHDAPLLPPHAKVNTTSKGENNTNTSPVRIDLQTNAIVNQAQLDLAVALVEPRLLPVVWTRRAQQLARRDVREDIARDDGSLGKPTRRV